MNAPLVSDICGSSTNDSSVHNCQQPPGEHCGICVQGRVMVSILPIRKVSRKHAPIFQVHDTVHVVQYCISLQGEGPHSSRCRSSANLKCHRSKSTRTLPNMASLKSLVFIQVNVPNLMLHESRASLAGVHARSGAWS